MGDVCRYGWMLMSSPCDLQITSPNLRLPVERSGVHTVCFRLTFLSRTAELCSVNPKNESTVHRHRVKMYIFMTEMLHLSTDTRSLQSSRYLSVTHAPLYLNSKHGV